MFCPDTEAPDNQGVMVGNILTLLIAKRLM